MSLEDWPDAFRDYRRIPSRVQQIVKVLSQRVTAHSTHLDKPSLVPLLLPLLARAHRQNCLKLLLRKRHYG
jgi:hypothetical protein